MYTPEKSTPNVSCRMVPLQSVCVGLADFCKDVDPFFLLHTVICLKIPTVIKTKGSMQHGDMRTGV